MHRELSSVSCGDQMCGMGLGWDGDPKGGVIGLHMADSCCHTTYEAATSLVL